MSARFCIRQQVEYFYCFGFGLSSNFVLVDYFTVCDDLFMIKQWLCVKWALPDKQFPVVTLHRVVYGFYLTIRILQADTGQLAWLYMKKDES